MCAISSVPFHLSCQISAVQCLWAESVRVCRVYLSANVNWLVHSLLLLVLPTHTLKGLLQCAHYQTMPGQSSSQLYSTFDNSTFLPLVIHSLCKFSNWPDTGADHSHSGITKHVARKLLSCSVFYLSLLLLIWSLLVLYGLHFPIGHWDRTTLDDDFLCWNVKDHREADINARDFIRWLWCLAGWLLGIVCHQLHQQHYHYYLNYPWPSAHRHCFFLTVSYDQ